MSMSREEMIALVDRFYESAAAGDWDTVQTLLTDDFEVWEADCMPMAGRWKGLQGFQDLFAKVMGMAAVADLERVETLAGPERVMAIVKMSFADPSLEQVELCETFEFRDGKCSLIKPYYFDPDVFNAACAAHAASQSA